MNSGFCVLNEVYEIVLERLKEMPEGSYTARLARGGVEFASRKLGEEAVEVIVEALRGGSEDLAEEAGDLLYHLLVVLALRGVGPRDVERVLRARMKG
ncbi:MAG: phosphoribosyl-ATP diphosphatase [Desulfurococcales archaeon]|nr:phosphoribosyl-ATP diphosphatase [Desulfurococcales archaeon]